MNERIYELAQQAGFENGHQGRDGQSLSVELEKFARLIVRECNQAVLAVPCYYKDYRSQIEESVIHDCARTVLEHFGVE